MASGGTGTPRASSERSFSVSGTDISVSSRCGVTRSLMGSVPITEPDSICHGSICCFLRNKGCELHISPAVRCSLLPSALQILLKPSGALLALCYVYLNCFSRIDQSELN
jgi:hypothetical protein